MTSKSKPIADSFESVPQMPSHVRIFRVECSPYWWTRCFVNGRYTVRSTGVDAKSANKRNAYAFAKEVYTDALINVRVNPRSKVKSRSFAVIANALVVNQKTTAKKSLYLNDKGKVEGFLIPHFKTKNIDEIEYGDLVEMMEKMNEKGLAPATKKHYLSLVSKIFKFAVQEGILKIIPQLPKISGRLKTKEKRDYLTKGEYTVLNNASARLAKAGEKVRGVAITEEMRLLNKFMVNSFLRPTDIKVLKHKHISKKVGKDEYGEQVQWLALNHPATKTTAYEVQAMPATLEIYEELIRFRKADHKEKFKEANAIVGKDKYGKDKRDKAIAELAGSPYLDPDDYVFFPSYKNRQTMMGIWGRLFRKVVAESKLETKTGKNLQLYSLRHTAIMFRLMFGNVDTLLLAKNARTSQGVIEQFYGSHLTTDQGRKQLHSFVERKTLLSLDGSSKTKDKQ